MPRNRNTLLAISAVALAIAGGYLAGASVSKTGSAEQTTRQVKAGPPEVARGREGVATGSSQATPRQAADRAPLVAARAAADQGALLRSYENGAGSEMSQRSSSDEPHLATVLADPALFGAILENTPDDPNKLLAWPKR